MGITVIGKVPGHGNVSSELEGKERGEGWPVLHPQSSRGGEQMPGPARNGEVADRTTEAQVITYISFLGCSILIAALN